MLKAGVELYPFQKIGHTFIKQRKWCLIADSMGLGKSIQKRSQYLKRVNKY